MMPTSANYIIDRVEQVKVESCCSKKAKQVILTSDIIFLFSSPLIVSYSCWSMPKTQQLWQWKSFIPSFLTSKTIETKHVPFERAVDFELSLSFGRKEADELSSRSMPNLKVGTIWFMQCKNSQYSS